MTTAHIIATASLRLNMEGASWPAETVNWTDQQKLDWWLEAAKKEPSVAFESADWIISGIIEK